MDCKAIEKRGIAEKYRAGRLSPDEGQAYELHCLSCDACFADMELGTRAAECLRANGEEFFPAEAEAERRGRLREHALGKSRSGPVTWRWVVQRPAWAGGLVAACAVLVLAFFVNENAQRTRELRELWTPRPHPYIASELRGGTGWAEFQRGIELYQEGRYGDAVEPLRVAARLAPEKDAVRFYLGVSLLMSGQPREARRALKYAAQRMPSSSLIRWYLAQAELQTGHLREAERLLREMAATRGMYASEADSLLGRIAQRSR